MVINLCLPLSGCACMCAHMAVSLPVAAETHRGPSGIHSQHLGVMGPSLLFPAPSTLTSNKGGEVARPAKVGKTFPQRLSIIQVSG